jgi:hypothetical protein
MDHKRFDDLTRALATTTSRREFLKTLASSTFGGLLALSGLDKVFAKPCTPNGKHCNQGKECCSGYCDPATHYCAPAPTTTTTTTTTTTAPPPTTTTTTTAPPPTTTTAAPSPGNL